MTVEGGAKENEESEVKEDRDGDIEILSSSGTASNAANAAEADATVDPNAAVMGVNVR